MMLANDSNAGSMLSSNTNSDVRTEEILDHVAAMRQQEMKSYKKYDYLYLQQQQQHIQTNFQQCYGTGHKNSIPPLPFVVDRTCHNKMINWSYQLATVCEFQRIEIVEIALSYISRFMSTSKGTAALTDRAMYQLVCMTCFYIAVKIHEPTAIDPHLISTLSGNAHKVHEIEAMERMILLECQWKMNPPTSLSYCRYLLELVPTHLLSSVQKRQVYDIVCTQIEISILDYTYIEIQASTLAYCALVNALKEVLVVPSPSNITAAASLLTGQMVGIDSIVTYNNTNSTNNSIMINNQYNMQLFAYISDVWNNMIHVEQDLISSKQIVQVRQFLQKDLLLRRQRLSNQMLPRSSSSSTGFVMGDKVEPTTMNDKMCRTNAATTAMDATLSAATRSSNNNNNGKYPKQESSKMVLMQTMISPREIAMV